MKIRAIFQKLKIGCSNKKFLCSEDKIIKVGVLDIRLSKELVILEKEGNNDA